MVDALQYYRVWTVRVLGFLHKNGASTAMEIAKCIQEDPKQVYVMIESSSLYSHGLVRKVKDPDGRVKYMLSRKGEKLGQRVVIRKGTLTIRDK